jgi:hypothetical protein
LPPDWEAYKHPEGKPLWDYSGAARIGRWMGRASLQGVRKWPTLNPLIGRTRNILIFSPTLEKMDRARENGIAVFGRPWTYISTLATNFFGMEGLFIKMYTNPSVVEAAIDHFVEFYLVADRNFLR